MLTSSERYELPIVLKFENGKGFFLSLLKSAMEQIKMTSDFVNVSFKSKSCEFTTLALKQQNARVNEALNEVLLMSESAISRLIERITAVSEVLYNIVEAIASLDMVRIIDQNRSFIKRALAGVVRSRCHQSIVCKTRIWM